MNSLEVTFTLATPVVIESEHPVHFDGLLASCVAQEAQEFGSATAWADADDLSHLLERTDADANGEWVWKASQLVYEPASEKFLTSIVRRCEPEAFMQAQSSGLLAMRRQRSYLSSAAGPERGYFLNHTYQWMRSAKAWCIGDPVEIQAALQRVLHLGKMGRNGYGMVSGITVDVVPDAGLWRRRFMPSGHAIDVSKGYIPGLRRLHAPYWLKSDVTQVQMPI